MEIQSKLQTGDEPREIEFRVIAYQRCKTCNISNNTPGFDPAFPNGDVQCPDCDGGTFREEVSFEAAVANTRLFQQMLEALANCVKTNEGIVSILTKAGLVSPGVEA